MKESKKIRINVVSNIICDHCKSEIEHPSDAISINHTFGFQSKRDMDKISLDFCEDCFEDLIGEKLMYRGLAQGQEKIPKYHIKDNFKE